MSEISVLVNNYNYGRFLRESVYSVLAQDFQDFELVIVDDGSTDDSREIMRAFTDPRVKCVFKENGGQLSAFNAGVAASRGDIICFLDADDIYQPGYLAAVSRFFAAVPSCGCLFAPVEYTGQRNGMAENNRSPGRIGCNPFSAVIRHVWTGTVTSACSMRRSEVLKFLPYTGNEKYWVTRADDLLMWGADIVGAVKYALDGPAVKYRIHGNNFFAGGKSFSDEDLQKRRREVERFCDVVTKRNKLSFTDLIRDENLKSSLPFRKRFICWLAALRRKNVSLAEWFVCGIILLKCGK